MPRVQHSWAVGAVAYSWASCLIASAGTPVTSSPRCSVQCSTDSAYSSKLDVAWATKPSWYRSDLMISHASVLESAMSDPTSIPSHTSAQAAEDVRLGSTANILAPLLIALRTWWK